MWTRPIDKNNALIECQAFIDDLLSKLIKTIAGHNLISFGKKLEALEPIDSSRVLFESKPSNSTQRVLKNALLEMCVSSEHIKPGSSFFSLLSFCYHFKAFRNTPLNDFHLDFINSCKNSYRGDTKALANQVNNFNSNSFINQVIKSIIELGSFNSSIAVSTWDGYESKIENKYGARFQAKLPDQFVITTNINQWKGSDVLCVVVDGIIETVSEIHHLLERASEHKKTMCIIARGFKEEVLATLGINFLRGTLSCIPIQLDTGLYTINTLKDIALSAKANMVSSLKGELISSIKYDELHETNFISANCKELIIHNKSSIKGVSTHIRHLRKRIEEEESEAVIKLLEDRISALSPNLISINLGTHLGEMRGLYKDRISQLIGILNTVCKDGVINVGNFEFDSAVFKQTSHMLKINKFNFVPAGAFYEGMKIGILTSHSIKNSAGFIVEDKC